MTLKLFFRKYIFEKSPANMAPRKRLNCAHHLLSDENLPLDIVKQRQRERTIVRISKYTDTLTTNIIKCVSVDIINECGKGKSKNDGVSKFRRNLLAMKNRNCNRLRDSCTA